MAAIEIVFSGLFMFAEPMNGTVMVTAVTGNRNEVHGAWIVRGKEKLSMKGKVVLTVAGQPAPIEIDPSFEKYVPSVTAALKGAQLTDLRPDPCIQSPDGKGCRYRNGYLKLIGGNLSAKLGDDKRVFSFKRGADGEYQSQMSHEVSWKGSATHLVVDGKRWTLQPGDRIEISNHPQTNSGRHFGVLRHLWGASDNDTDENWPLPISQSGLRQSLVTLLERRVDGKEMSDAELWRELVEIRLISRPIFCPPARQ
jgi:hypothetical protein